MTPAERLLLLLLAGKALIPPADHPAHVAIDQRILRAMHELDGEAAAEHADRDLLRRVARLAVATAVVGYTPLSEVRDMAAQISRRLDGTS
mgnify:CR=1 FL=1